MGISSREFQTQQIPIRQIYYIKLIALGFILFVFLQVSPTFYQAPLDEEAMLKIFSVAIISIFFIVSAWSMKWLTNYFEQLAIHMSSILESSLFIGVVTNIIIMTGCSLSPYKFLYFFSIIISSLRSGKQLGIVVSIVSSLFLIGIQIITVNMEVSSQLFQTDLVLCGFFLIIPWVIGHYHDIESDYVEKTKQLDHVDSLTEVYNHRYFKEILEKKVKSTNPKKQHLSLVILDIDDFKLYNEYCGYKLGDSALKKISSLLINHTSATHIVSRYGGEEFAIILPETSEEQAYYLATEWHYLLKQTRFKGEEQLPNGKLTLSMGIASYPLMAKNSSELIRQADDALYRAKYFNKNHIETYHPILEYLNDNITSCEFELLERIKTLMGLLYLKDSRTYGHVERVVTYAKLIGQEMNLSEIQLQQLICGCYLHDIGKLDVPLEILNKKMPLDNDEWLVLRSHAENGATLLSAFDNLLPFLMMVKHHHERFDGRGYPSGLKGDEIPLLVRILTVADSFDAMTSQRPYNIKMTYEAGLEELKQCSAAQFDPEVVVLFVQALEKYKHNLEFM